MKAYQMMVATLDDLSEVTIVCGTDNCSARATFRIDSSKVPDACPVCSIEFDMKIRLALELLSRFHNAAKHSKFKIEFPIKTIAGPGA